MLPADDGGTDGRRSAEQSSDLLDVADGKGVLDARGADGHAVRHDGRLHRKADAALFAKCFQNCCVACAVFAETKVKAADDGTHGKCVIQHIYKRRRRHVAHGGKIRTKQIGKPHLFQ